MSGLLRVKLLSAVVNLVNKAVLKRFLCGHEVVALGVAAYRFIVLARVVGENAVKALLCFLEVIRADLDIGHLAPMMPMISGAVAKVHSVGNSIDIRYIYE